MSHELVLYGYWRSSSTYRVRLALHHKGLAFRTVIVNILAGAHHAADHAARSPLGYVPCLEVDGKPFVESTAIVELLEDLKPEPRLYPRDPFDRARVRALVEIIAADTQPLQNLNVLNRVSEDPAAKKAWAQHFIARGLAGFERLMESNAALGITGRYVYGDAITAADFFLLPQLYNARRFGIDLTPFPRLTAAGEAASKVPAAHAAHPEQQPDAQIGT